MKEWQDKKRGTSSYDAGGTSTGSEATITLPLSQGEWDEPIGLPLCVVCHNVRFVDANCETVLREDTDCVYM